MRFFIDTACIADIEAAHGLGVISGVTTNPSLIAKERRDVPSTIADIARIVDGPVSAEVMGDTAEEMVREGRALAAIAPQVVVKIPMTGEGLRAVSQLHREGIRTNVTLIFSTNQALLAARAGATYVSPFVGRLDDIGMDGIELVADIADLFAMHGIETEIIAASIRHSQHVLAAARAGAHIATVPYKVLMQCLQHPLTDAGIEKFIADWKAVQH